MRAILSSLYSWCRIWEEKVATQNVKTQLYRSSLHLICMHCLQIKLQRSILPKATIHGNTNPSENILPDIYCQILPAVGMYCYDPARIFSQTAKPTRAIIPFVQACPVNAPYHALPFAVYLTISFWRKICLFFISFSLVPSMCPSILFLQNKASILIHQWNVVCMRFLNI